MKKLPAGWIAHGLPCCVTANSEWFRNMPDLIPVLKRDEICTKVAAVAEKISKDYADRELTLVGVLKGAFVFLSDLIRQLSISVQIDFVRTSSYGSGTASSEKIQLTKALEIDIQGKDVLIVEDIIDTGLTLEWLVEYVQSFHPKSVKICTMVDKRERRKSSIRVDYACHVAQKGFLVGYGLDYAENYRGLPDICHMKL